MVFAFVANFKTVHFVGMCYLANCVLLYRAKTIICQQLFLKKSIKSMHSDVLIVIPARIGSTRLPRKPLELIGERSMIEHAAGRVKETGLANVYVATDSEDIAAKCQSSGIDVIMTDENCPSGTDRVYQAFKNLPNHDKLAYVVNVQGDMPFVSGKTIVELIEQLKASEFDIMTPVVRVGQKEAAGDSNVKVVADQNGRALYFSRSMIPYGSEEFLYHVGIYGFKVEALERFVSLPQTKYEIAERLEQLRALENGMSIGICYSDNVPISVDTAEDLAKAKEYLGRR